MRIRPVPVALLTAAVLGLAGCGAAPAADGADPAAAAPAAAASTAPAATASPTAGAAAPVGVPAQLRFTARTLDGQAFDGASLAGKATVLWFWAPWCATCAGQAWSVSDMVAAHGDKVAIVGVGGMGDDGAKKSFVKEFSLQKTTQLDDRGGAVWKRFGITEQSVFVIFDRNGRMVHNGWMDGPSFEQKVAALAA